MGSLPSPSNMGWDDIGKILNGHVPRGENATHIAETASVQHVQEVRDQLERLLLNTSEMEATARVLLYVFEAAWFLYDVKITLQPSISKHSVFTDFLLIRGSDQSMKSFIEVKRTDISTHLTLRVKSTMML